MCEGPKMGGGGGGQDKTADFENETKPPVLKWDKSADFVKENKVPSKFVSRIKASWPNYR